MNDELIEMTIVIEVNVLRVEVDTKLLLIDWIDLLFDSIQSADVVIFVIGWYLFLLLLAGLLTIELFVNSNQTNELLEYKSS